MNTWSIPTDWKGQAAAILGSGPSMSMDVANKIHASGLRSIAVNDQGIDKTVTKDKPRPAMAPWADILYAADRDWWYENRIPAACFKGLKVSVFALSHRDFPILLDTMMLGNGGQRGFDDRKDHIRTGDNSGYQAMHVAAHLGASPILLFGFDMHGTHWFGDHHWRQGHVPRFSHFVKMFEAGEPEFRKRGIEIVNCTPGSSMRCFPIMGPDQGIEYALQVVRRKTSQAERSSEETFGGA